MVISYMTNYSKTSYASVYIHIYMKEATSVQTVELITRCETSVRLHCKLKQPTDLSPEDRWRNPVRSICAFSYLDNGNLD